MFNDILAIIPARIGSKRLHRKNNMKLLGSFSLWENTVNIAKNAGIINIAISTDDNEILDLPGQDIILLKRSNELAEDGVSTEDVIREVILQVSHRSLKYDTICLLQPTSPLLQYSTLQNAIMKYYIHRNSSQKYSCVVAVNKDYKPCGAFYIFDRESFIKHGTIWMPGITVYVVDEKEAIDIDYIWDFRISEAIIRGNVI